MIPRDFQRTALGPRQRRVVFALAEALFAPDGEVLGPRLDALVVETDAYLGFASRGLRFALAVGLEVLRLLPLFVIGRARLIDELPLEERVRFVEALDRSRVPLFSLLIALYKTILSMLFFEDEEGLRALGYPGRPREKHALSLLGTKSAS